MDIEVGVFETQVCKSIPAILKFLSDGENKVVLRNADVMTSLNRGSDVDVLVRDIANAKTELFAALGSPSWVINRSYVSSNFYRWGHIDLLQHVDWRGAAYISNSDLLSNSIVQPDGVRIPSPSHEAVICWLTSILWGGFFKDRYRDLIVRTASQEPAALFSLLARATGNNLANRLMKGIQSNSFKVSRRDVSSLRRAVWFRAFRRSPVQTLLRYILFFACEIRLLFEPGVPWFAILGPDGSGKSTVLDSLSNRLDQRGVRSSRFHWRPQLIRPGKQSGPVFDPHSAKPRGFVASLAKLVLLATDWIVGYWVLIARARTKGRLVFFDRHYIDILVDPRRYRYGGPVWLAQLFRHVIPNPSLYILLDAPTEVLQTRKQEVSPAETERQRLRYLELFAETQNSFVVDATLPVEQIVDRIEALIFESGCKPSNIDG